MSKNQKYFKCQAFFTHVSFNLKAVVFLTKFFMPFLSFLSQNASYICRVIENKTQL